MFFSRDSIQCFFLKNIFLTIHWKKGIFSFVFHEIQLNKKHRVIFLISWDPIKKHRVIFLISWDPIKKTKGSFLISWDLVHINFIRHFFFSAWLPLVGSSILSLPQVNFFTQAPDQADLATARPGTQRSLTHPPKKAEPKLRVKTSSPSNLTGALNHVYCICMYMVYFIHKIHIHI
jgi:hypothetical protein